MAVAPTLYLNLASTFSRLSLPVHAVADSPAADEATTASGGEEHEDRGLLTLIAGQSAPAGLEVYDRVERAWVSPHTDEATVVVLVGATLYREHISQVGGSRRFESRFVDEIPRYLMTLRKFPSFRYITNAQSHTTVTSFRLSERMLLQRKFHSRAVVCIFFLYMLREGARVRVPAGPVFVHHP